MELDIEFTKPALVVDRVKARSLLAAVTGCRRLSPAWGFGVAAFHGFTAYAGLTHGCMLSPAVAGWVVFLADLQLKLEAIYKI